MKTDYHEQGVENLITHGTGLYPDVFVEKLMKTKSGFCGKKLYRNDAGKFKDVTGSIGIISSMIGFGLGISMGDLNNDGWLDFVTVDMMPQ